MWYESNCASCVYKVAACLASKIKREKGTKMEGRLVLVDVPLCSLASLSTHFLAEPSDQVFGTEESLLRKCLCLKRFHCAGE